MTLGDVDEALLGDAYRRRGEGRRIVLNDCGKGVDERGLRARSLPRKSELCGCRKQAADAGEHRELRVKVAEELAAPTEIGAVDPSRVRIVASEDGFDHREDFVVRDLFDDEGLRVAARAHAAEGDGDDAVRDQDVFGTENDHVADPRLAVIRFDS